MFELTRQILISAPKESVELYLRDLRRLEDYEPKIDKIELPETSDGTLEAEGKFMAIPWRASFQVDFTRDGGYRKEMVRGPLKSMSTGFHLRAVPGGTLVTHDEKYDLPVVLKPLSPVLRPWVWRTMELELAAIKEGAEALHRQRQLEQLERAV